MPKVFSEKRLKDAKQNSITHSEIPARDAEAPRIWFHAASVGELEMLWTVIDKWADKGAEIIVTIFSESAQGQIEKIRAMLATHEIAPLFLGYAPWEGEWSAALAKTNPSIFVTARYEAWPDLWISLAEQNIPLAIVGARARRSLKVAKSACRMMGGKIPQITFFTASETDANQLRNDFPQARIQLTGETRWDRVTERAQAGSPRAKELITRFQSAPRPWGILAQVWPEDICLWEEMLSKLPGTLWIVPHKIDPEHLAALEQKLKEAAVHYIKTSTQPDPVGRQALLVDEMGFLLELYSGADWAYVGGGLGDGVHSTIEPAIRGIPISCAPEGTELFPEIDQLTHCGQLTILQGEEDVEQWVKQNARVHDSEQKNRWMKLAKNRLGATQRIVDHIQEIVTSR